jgi:translation elongation factor EF-Ts
MTADLLNALADVLTALGPARWYIQNPDHRRDFHDAAGRLAVLLDCHEGAAVADLAKHVRAHAAAIDTTTTTEPTP